MRTLLVAGILAALFLGGAASADPGAPSSPTTETQTVGSVIVRTETSTVIENGVQFRIVRVFNNDVLVREVRTSLGAVAGFESAPRGSIIVIEEHLEPAAATARQDVAAPRAITRLPSTSTSR